MNTSDLLKPTLYAVNEHGATVLLGGRCHCGYIFFPLQTFGCERCGRTNLQPVELRGRGKVIASTVVHLHADPRRSAPFTVATIALDDGPVIRTLLTTDIDVEPETAVEAVLIPINTSEGASTRDLRFRPTCAAG